ncbi:MAG: hypothetical protein WBN40_12220 [Pseudomonadales bacterium]
MDTQTLAIFANYAEIIGATSTVSGLIFGLMQVRPYRQPWWAEWFDWLGKRALEAKRQV